MAVDPRAYDPSVVGWGAGNPLVGYLPVGGLNREGMDLAGYANTPGGLGDFPNPTMQDIINGLGGLGMAAGLAMGPGGIIGLGGTMAASDGQAHGTMGTLAGIAGNLFGFGGTDETQNAAGAASNPNVGGFAGVDMASQAGKDAAANAAGGPNVGGAGADIAGGVGHETPDGGKGQEMYAAGGYTGNQPVTKPVGEVHGQEFVLSAPAVRALGLPFLTALNEHAKAMMDPRNASDRMRMAQAFHANGLVK